jgi:hypothetical protein
MFKDISEIKEFIEWCKVNKIKAFCAGDISFELSELGLIENLQPSNVPVDTELLETAQMIKEDSKFEEQQQAEEDEDLLFYSSDS